VFLWGFTGVLGRAITLDSVWLVWYRLLITAVSLWLLFGLQKRLVRPRRGVLPIALIGVVQALHWVCFYGSIKWSNVTIALTTLATSALLSALIEPLVLRRRFDFVEIFLGFFAIAGIAIIYQTHLQFGAGIILGLVSALLTVFVSVLNKKWVDAFPPEEITVYQLSGGFLGLTLLLPLYTYLFPEGPRVPGATDWLWLTVLSWVCTIYTFFLYIRSLKKVSAFTMNLTLTLEPVYGILLAFVLYQENRLLSNWFYLGFALIALAVAYHMLRLIKPVRFLKAKE
jgi:drug/metabolite transporter (DMT)-like permease